LEDNSGKLWIGTREGLNKFDPKTEKFTVYKNDPQDPESLSHNNVRSIFEDSSGMLWIGTWGGGVNKFDRKTEKFTVYKHDPQDPESLSWSWVLSIFEDSSGMLWIGTGNGLNKLDPKTEKFTVYINNPQDSESLSYNRVLSIFEEKSGNLWIGTGNGLNKFDRKTEKFTVYKNDPQDPESLSSNWVSSTLEDKSGRLWIGTREGLNKFDPKTEKFTVYKNDPQDPGSLSHNGVSSILEDNSGIIWIGTLYGGLNKFDSKAKKFTLFQHNPQDPESLSNNIVRSIIEDKSGSLWIGTWGGGLNKFDSKTKKFTLFQHNPQDPESISSNVVHSIFEDKSGNLWIGTGNGLNKFDPKTEKFTVYPESLSNAYIITILEDKSGNIWIGGEVGLSKLNPKTEKLTVYKHDPQNPESLSHNVVISIFEDSSGKLWIGTEAGWLNKLDPKTEKFTGYKNDPQDPESLSHNTVISIFEDSSGTLWFGTSGGGLNKLVPPAPDFSGSGSEESIKFIHYTTKDGLPDNTIHGLLEDDKGNLWISTGKGLSKFTPLKSPLKGGIQRGVFKNYSVEDLLQDIEFHGPTACKSKSGEMFFGGIKGFVSFFPDSIKDNSFIPPVVITKFKLFNESVFPGEDSPLKYSISETSTIELKYNKNFLSFEFAALNYSNPENNQYKYRMTGVDPDTVYAGTKRFAEYTDIRPGDYTFWVTGSNNDGIWNEKGTSIDIIIKPPLWKTNLAYGSYVVLIILGIAGYIRRRTWKLRKDKEILEKQVKERTKQISQQKEEILTANEELEQQKEELQITLENLQKTQSQLVESEKMAALGGLVAGVAHEINTPVGISVTAASALVDETKQMADLYKQDQISRADFKEYLKSANQSAQLILSNMERTATMIQSFKQVSVDQSTEQKRKFKLREYFEDVIRSLYPKLKKIRTKINLEIDEDLELDSYPGPFSQIITNLVLNSLEHGFASDRKGEINISAKVEERSLVINYRDDGTGISKETLPKIFDPFFTTNKQIGTGLGLHIVYNLVTQKFKGTIKCESEEGKGVVFRIVVPVGN
ncbi:MAG: hypothetical protein KAX05_15335, partial [Bacteroidales bacterium]|nr:hypothetical protein [Bacteroidales bacterium]